MQRPPEILTIGHSNHSFETFLEMLRRHQVSVVADVRSTPYSGRHPQFNRERLQAALPEQGVDYAFFGEELGARPQDASCYQHGRVSYARLAGRAAFHAGVDRLVQQASADRIAIMCAEKEPLECHRTLLVAPALESLGAAVTHIKSDGALESHHDAMLRLLDKLGMPRADLFHSEDELVRAALQRQEAKIAYVNEHKEVSGGERRGRH